MPGPSGATAVHAIPYPIESDAPPDVPRDMLALANWLDAHGLAWVSATLATLAAGKAGTLNRASDTGAVFWDDGAALHNVVGQVLYGDGSDGNVTLATDITLTRDMYYDTLDLAGHTIHTASFRVFCRTLLKWNGGTIDNSGSNASAQTGGASPPQGTWGAASTTGTGANGTITTPNNNGGGAATIPSLGGAGGKGGNATGTPSVTAPTALQGGPIPKDIHALLRGMAFSTGSALPIGVGAAGGGAGGDGTNFGGGGGGAGGVAAVFARHMTGSGTLSAHGGNGAAGVAGNASGGGGGGGGVTVLVTNNATHSVTFDVSGGAGAAAHIGGTGVAGTNGSAGTAIAVLGGS